MSRSKLYLKVLIALFGVFVFFDSTHINAQHNHRSTSEERKIPEKTEQDTDQSSTVKPEMNPQKSNEAEKVRLMPSIGLAQLEELALSNNPTLKQSDSSILAAEGRKIQVGLLPNPVVGLSAEDLSFRNFRDGGKVGFFVEQRIPLGGKLAKRRRVFEQDVNLAETAKQAQRARVLNSVRLLYLEVLGAQAEMELKRELAKLADEAVETEAELYNVGLADRPDQLKTEISQKRAEADYLDAVNRYEEAWSKLASMVGKPEMQPAPLSGGPADSLGEVNTEELLANLLKESPEIKAAEVKLERAKLAVKRARAEKIPDLTLRAGVGYNNELIEEITVKRRAGPEGFVEVGVTVPIFDRNQGGIKTAEAELAIAEREVQRVRLALRTKYAEVLRNYRTAVSLADRYRTQIVPKAKAAYEMYSVNFQNMTAAYTNVLTARAAYLRAQIEYARNLTRAQQAIVLLKGFLLSGGLNGTGETVNEENNAPVVSPENPVNDGGEDQE